MKSLFIHEIIERHPAALQLDFGGRGRGSGSTQLSISISSIDSTPIVVTPSRIALNQSCSPPLPMSIWFIATSPDMIMMELNVGP